MKATTLCIVVAMLFASCRKLTDVVIDKVSTPANSSGFIKYTIRQGNQYCDQSGFAAVETSEMKFVVKFDSSAIYQTKFSENQYDINKLFGFSDNNADHHQFSARIGWRWSDNALRLFGYVYNNGIMVSKEISPVKIGDEINCFIRVAGNSYIFQVNEGSATMPRLSTTDNAKGYQLYPYFGGDETAPHEINIWIKQIP
jgi:hypothetical protein